MSGIREMFPSLSGSRCSCARVWSGKARHASVVLCASKNRTLTHAAVLDERAGVGRDNVSTPSASANELARAGDELLLELVEAHLWRWTLQGQVAHEERGAGLSRDGVERGGGDPGRGVAEEGEQFLDGGRVGPGHELSQSLYGCDGCRHRLFVDIAGSVEVRAKERVLGLTSSRSSSWPKVLTGSNASLELAVLILSSRAKLWGERKGHSRVSPAGRGSTACRTLAFERVRVLC